MNDALKTDSLLKDVPEVVGLKVLGACVLYVRAGKGGMGAVYRGRHLKLDMDVAVKCLLPGIAAGDERMVLRFQREGRLAARLNHPNLVRVFDVDYQHGLHYIVMEYVEGETARERVVRKGGALNVGEAVTIVLEAARGLDAVHSQGIVHRDIKPDNILISTRAQVKLGDLGLGCMFDDVDSNHSLTLSGVALGTPRYMPPEQWDGLVRVGPRGDLWALGATLYFLVAGEDAFDAAQPTEIMRRVCTEPFPDSMLKVPELPSAVAEVIRKCTERKPEDRYATAGDLVDALEAAVRKHGLKGKVGEAKARSRATDSSLVSPPPEALLARVRLHLESEKSSDLSRGAAGLAVTASGPILLTTAPAPARKKRTALYLAGAAVLGALAAGAFLGLRLGGPQRTEALASSPVATSPPAERSFIGPETLAPVPAPAPAPKKEREAPAPEETARPAARVESVARGGETAGREVLDAGTVLLVPAPAPHATADSTPPALRVDLPRDGAFERSPVEVSGTAEDETAVEVRVNGREARVLDGKWRVDLELRDGARQVIVVATDAAKNVTRASRTVLVDTTPPVIEVLEPTGAGPLLTREREVFIRARVKDDGETREVRIGGAAVQGDHDVFGLRVTAAEGENRIEILATDAAGNEARSAVGFVCDRTPPSLVLSEPVDRVAGGRVTVRGRMTDRTGSSVRVNGIEAAVSPDGAWEAVLIIPPGRRMLRVEATDAAGNAAVPVEASVLVLAPEVAPREFPGFTPLGKNAQGCRQYRHDSTGLVFVLVPGGTFTMGSPPGETARVAGAIARHQKDSRAAALLEEGLREDDTPREVTLEPFLIAKHELSQAAWTRVLGENPSRVQGDDLPVDTVSWDRAKEFCLKTGLRLPTEAEWECACRAGTTTAFAFGDSVATDAVNFNGNYPIDEGPRGAYRAAPLPVGSLGPNAFGIHNMHGNVAEWCEDAFTLGSAGKRRAPVLNAPAPAAKALLRAFRGGSWAGFGWAARSAARDGAPPARGHHLRGFRPAF